jgi:hypothetical protein
VVELPVPDYSIVSRRQGSLAVTLPSRKRVRYVVIDSTGLKVYGAGEWHVQKHRSGRRRAWRKRHLGVDDATKGIVAVEVTASSVHDSLMLPELLGQIHGRVCQVSGDGAYDTRTCYEAIDRRPGGHSTSPACDSLGAKRGRVCPDTKYELTPCSDIWPVQMAKIERLHPAESRRKCLLAIQDTVCRGPRRSTT